MTSRRRLHCPPTARRDHLRAGDSISERPVSRFQNQFFAAPELTEPGPVDVVRSQPHDPGLSGPRGLGIVAGAHGQDARSHALPNHLGIPQVRRCQSEIESLYGSEELCGLAAGTVHQRGDKDLLPALLRIPLPPEATSDRCQGDREESRPDYQQKNAGKGSGKTPEGAGPRWAGPRARREGRR